MSSRHVLEGRLVCRPTPTATSIAWELWWELSIDDGIHGAGPAGVASFTVPPKGPTMWSDYAEPGRLLRLDVPFGQVARVGSDEQLLAAGAIGDDDRVLVERLVGVAVVEALLAAQDTSFTTRLLGQPSWNVAGRVALAHSILADGTRPVSGPGALEVAALLADLDAGEAVAAYRLELLVGAEEHDDEAVVGTGGETTETAGVADVQDPAGDPIESPQLRDETGAVTPIRVHLDHTVEGLASEATATVNEGRLTVRLSLPQPIEDPPRALRELEVLVTADEGLVAAGATFEPTTEGLAATLRLPPSAVGTALDVVIGRELPQEPLDEYRLAERAAIHVGRVLADDLRRLPIPRWLTVAEIRGEDGPSASRVRSGADAAVRRWERAGRSDLVRAVETLRPAEPFETEQIAVAVDPEPARPGVAAAERAPATARGSGAETVTKFVCRLRDAGTVVKELFSFPPPAVLGMSYRGAKEAGTSEKIAWAGVGAHPVRVTVVLQHGALWARGFADAARAGRPVRIMCQLVPAAIDRLRPQGGADAQAVGQLRGEDEVEEDGHFDVLLGSVGGEGFRGNFLEALEVDIG